MKNYYDYGDDSAAQSGESVFTRVCSGFIASVDELNGTVIVEIEDFLASRGSVELSFDYISSVGPGWFRFMPSIGDKVLCGFRPNNSLEILRYKAISYPQLAQFEQDANPAFVFRQLKSGEFEVMSSGFAEIWGSQTGKLHLAGGLASIDLDFQTSQATYSAVTHAFQSDGSMLNFGSVRRSNPLTIYSDEADTVPGIAQKELTAILYQNIGGVSTTLYNASIGQVLDYVPALPQGVFTPRLQTSTSVPLAADINVYTSDGIQKARFQIDKLGNTRVDSPASATDGFRLNVPLGQFVLSALKVSLSSTAGMSLSDTLEVAISSAAQISLSAPVVSLGGGVGTLIKISNSVTTLNTLLQQLIAQIEALATATAAITVTGVTPGGGTSAIPVNAPAIVAIGANLTALATEFSGLLQ